MKARITPRLLAELRSTATRSEVWDTAVPGLFVQIRPTGHAAYYARCTVNGAKHTVRLGNADLLTVATVRRKARRALADALTGRLQKNRAPPPVKTVREVAAQHYIPFAKASKKSWFLDARLLHNHILPYMGERRMDSLSVAEVDAWHKFLRDERKLAAATCNHALFVLNRLYKLALEIWELPGIMQNPAARVKYYKLNNQRQVYLKNGQIRQLLDRARDPERARRTPYIAAIITLLLLTGVRLSNALRARWDEFDEAARIWHVPHTKSGKHQDVWLSDAVIDMLARLPSRAASPWLFPNPRTRRPYTQIHYTWKKICAQVGLHDFRLHDLRHTFASIMIQQGYSLYVVQNALGHHSPNMTMRYAHLADSTLRQAVNAVGHSLRENAPGQPRVSRENENHADETID